MTKFILFAAIFCFSWEARADLSLLAQEALKQTQEYMKAHPDSGIRQDLVVLIDYSLPSTEKRLYLVDLTDGHVENYLVAHGKGSGDNVAKKFSNTPNSDATSLGFFSTEQIYSGDNGLSLRLKGLSKTNSNARSRAIVIHGADYVSQAFISRFGRLGRSHGCPAVEPAVAKMLIPRIANSGQGSTLIFAFGKDAP